MNRFFSPLYLVFVSVSLHCTTTCTLTIFFFKIIWEFTIYNPFIYLFILFPFPQITFSLFYCRCTSVKKLSIHYQHTFLHPFFILSTTIGVGGFASPVFVPGGGFAIVSNYRHWKEG